jgi:3-(3-hydroxy-phenyl)propionate hydroxylase
MTTTDTDVLICGCGPVGAALANLLGRQGVRTLVIDSATDIFTKPRAIALDNEALRILQSVGVRDGEFATVGIPQVQYHSPLFGRFAKINSAAVIDGHPMLVTFYQPELEALLRRKLAAYPQVQTALGTTLEGFDDGPSGVVARLRDAQGTTREVRARYLVGADGANSFVRRTLGLDFEGETYSQDWLIVDARDVPDPIDHIAFRCDPRRPAPHMVAPGGRQRWEFMLQPGEDRAEMEKPETIRALLAPWCDSAAITIERTAVYRFHAREAAAFSRGRVFLVGDAAHITPPFAGQGLVAGLRDVSNLAWKLSAVIGGRSDAAILASYDQERRPHARKIIALARFLGALVMPNSRLRAFLIHGLMSAARLVPAGRALFEDLKIKPQNAFDEGLFVRERGTRRLGAGHAFPQGWVRLADGRAVLSDDALGQGMALIGFGVDPAAALDPDLQARWRAAGGDTWQWCQRAQSQHLAPPERRLETLDNTLLPRQVPLGWVAIVRPDRCVMAEGPVARVAELVRQSLACLGTGDAPEGVPATACAMRHSPA